MTNKICCCGCDKELEQFSWKGKKGYHPNGGLEFVTYGHYGSTQFDPMDGSTLRLVICDECIEFALAVGKAKIVK